MWNDFIKEIDSIKQKNSIDNKFSDKQIEFMRADLENGMAYSRIIDLAKKNIEKEGKDFQEEFEKWKNNR